MSLTVYVNSIGVLGPGLANWQATADILAARNPYVSAPTILPALALLPPAERRRIGRVVKVALAVALEATTSAGTDAQSLPSVFSSSGSDGQICNEICRALATKERLVSPTRFSNSVHNAPAGYWSIATGNLAPSNVLCGHDASFVAGLLDAAAQARAEQVPVLLVSFDTEYPEPLHAKRPIPDAMGVAMILAPEASAASQARLSIEFCSEPPDQLRGELETLRTAIPTARALPLLQAIAAGEATQIVLEYLPDLQAHVRIEPCPLNRSWIESHIPHRPPMCLLDVVEHWDDGGIRCRSGTHRDPANPLRLGARLNAACGIEYAAQAMALHGALCAQAAGGTTARAGFLASVRDVRLQVARLDDIEPDLLCTATRVAGDSGSALYQFELSAAQRPLLSGRATVILNPEGAP